jgi:hypothetical protein
MEINIKFWIIVMGILMLFAVIIHGVCMLLQINKRMNLVRSLDDGLVNATRVDSNGAILPQVQYWKCSHNQEKECTNPQESDLICNQRNLKYNSSPLTPGYQFTNEVFQVWKPDHQMENLYNYNTLHSMVYPPGYTCESISVHSIM